MSAQTLAPPLTPSRPPRSTSRFTATARLGLGELLDLPFDLDADGVDLFDAQVIPEHWPQARTLIRRVRMREP